MYTKGTLAGWLLKTFSFAIPNSIKRKIVMVACFYELERLKGRSPRLKKFNKALCLVENEALLNGLHDFSKIFSEEFLNKKNEPPASEIVAQCRYLYDHIPEFMRYATETSMIDDIASVVIIDLD